MGDYIYTSGNFNLIGIISVQNTEENKTLHESAVDVFIAPPEIESNIEYGGREYELIKSGKFRIGIRLKLRHEELQLVNTMYTIEILRIKVFGYPFGFL